MIELYTTDTPAAISYFTFDYKRLLPKEEDRIQWQEDIKGAAFYFLEEVDESLEFKTFFRQAVAHLVEGYRVYFLYLEPTSSQKSRLRTHRKMFRPRQEEIGADNLHDVEVPVSPTESVLVSSIRITEENMDFVFKHLASHMLTFVYLDRPSAQPPLPAQNEFLKQLVSRYSLKNGAYRINLPLLALRTAEAEALIFRLKRDGRNRQAIEWYGPPRQIDEMIEQLGRLFRWRKREALR